MRFVVDESSRSFDCFFQYFRDGCFIPMRVLVKGGAVLRAARLIFRPYELRTIPLRRFALDTMTMSMSEHK